MPKPSKISSSGSQTITKSNPLTAWFRDKKNKKAQKLEAKAKMMSNSRAENELAIVNVLRGIDFTDSTLPAEKLDYKSNEAQPYGDLEFAVLDAIDLMENNTQDYSGLDISAIDSKILEIAQHLSDAVRAGNVNRAFAAKSALIVAIDRIRNSIPTVPEMMRQDYIKTSADYLEIWTTLITSCTSLDVIEENLSTRKQSIETKQKNSEEENRKMAEKLAKDPEFNQKVSSVMDQTFIGNSTEWDTETMNIYNWLVKQRIEKSSLNFELLQYDMLIKQSGFQSKIVSDFQTKVIEVPVPTDPNLMNKYKEMVENEFKAAAEIDAQFDELGEFMDNIDQRIEMMANAKGSIRMKHMAMESVEHLAELAKKIQMEEAGINSDGNQMEKIRKIQLLTDEELQTMKEKQIAKEAEVQQQTQKHRERISN